MGCCNKYTGHEHHGRSASEEGTFYTCPMHAEIMRERPGICPECGMNLVQQKEGHRKHDGHRTTSFLQKFWVAVILSVPVFLYSPMYEALSGVSLPSFTLLPYVEMLLGSVLFFYCGALFLKSAWRELRGRMPGMMTLIALAITTAYLWSVYSVLAGRSDTLFFELGSLIAVMLLGHWLEMRSVQGATGALKELSKFLPDTADVEREGRVKVVPLSELVLDDVVRVKPGARISADGLILEGESEVNESLITGESKPVEKKAGTEVIAGSINGDGSLRIKVLHVGDHTFLAGVARLVAEAQASKSRLQILSDRAAFYLTIVAVGAGAVTFGTWFLLGAGISIAIERLVAVLVIACPHALGLAVPLVSSISTTKAANTGLLVKQRLALEAAREIDTVLFDKTGTLTKGAFAVTSISSEEILAFAAAVEVHSEHPIASAIVEEAKRRGLAVSDAKNFKRIPGRGGEAMIEGRRVFVGYRGGAGIEVAVDEKVVGTITVTDEVRPEAKEAVEQLKRMGLTLGMVTGDSDDVARDVAAQLGLDEYFSRVLPEDKQNRVKELQKRGKKVAFVGDGVNDAPALSEADLGIAIGAGTNVAIESAGIILVKNDPRDIVKIIALSRMTYQKMVQNLWWAAGYNLIAIPLAAGIAAPVGILLEPAVAAILMSFSTIIVALNALQLREQSL